MNKDIELLKLIFGDSPDILKLLNEVDKEIERLQARIDKAIEYIDHCIFDYEEYSMVGEDFVIVKNILRGSDKE